MIPSFDESGFLPPGIHRATLDDIASRFGRQSELRRVQMESVRWMVELAVRAGVERIVLNGSFVTDILEPNDVDCALLLADDYPRDAAASDELIKGLPFLEILRVDETEFNRLVHRFFASSRLAVIKGMIEISL
ncbi:MAG: hypothetical protein HOP29_13210 [Phycisphaerales bacterium]|nr:hypothetical protein [Phycisphaerales bacterium]